MNYEQIEYSCEGGIARILLNRPEERNAMTPQMGEEIAHAVEATNEDDDARVLVIRGTGRGFCSGASLKTLGKEAGVADDGEGLGGSERFYRLFLRIRSCRVPTIAAINGHAIGAGLCFALGTDLRVMHKDAKAGMTFVKLGIHPGMAATWNLPRLIGPTFAAELLYTGRIFTAEEALAMGLVNRVAGDRFDEVVEDLASQIASCAPLAVRATKRTLVGTFDRSIDEALRCEAGEQEETFKSEDAAEGISAMMEKRAPDFKGR